MEKYNTYIKNLVKMYAEKRESRNKKLEEGSGITEKLAQVHQVDALEALVIFFNRREGYDRTRHRELMERLETISDSLY